MTVVACKDGVMASDSRYTIESEAGGIRMGTCTKMYKKRVSVNGEEQDVLIGVAGEGFPALVFHDWYGSGSPPPDNLLLGEADFSAIVLTKDGLYEYDKWCRGEKVLDPFHAIGCGAKSALAAMHMGANAKRACEVTCSVDPLCGPPIVTMRLKNANAKKTRRPAVPALPKANDAGSEGAVR